MNQIDLKLLKVLPLQFQRIRIKKKNVPTRCYSSFAKVKALQSEKVECENFDRPISKILILPDEV